jgi:hypothetical protein
MLRANGNVMSGHYRAIHATIQQKDSHGQTDGPKTVLCAIGPAMT